jgi:uncharacterized protein (DUF342 family)
VVAGDVLAVVTPARPPEEGMTVTGETIPAPPGPTPASPAEPGDHVEILEDGVTYAVAPGKAGYADFHGG